MKAFIGVFFASFLFWLFFFAIIYAYAKAHELDYPPADGQDVFIVIVLSIFSTLAIWGLFL